MNFIIEVGDFPIYALMIFMSFIAGNLIYVPIFHEKRISKYILLACVAMNIMLTWFFGLVMSIVLSGFKSFGGLSAMGGAVGSIGAYLFSAKMFPAQKQTIRKALLLSVPLMYSVSKLGCHFAGCCIGMAYDGPFSVHYVGNKEYLTPGNLFPVQITETLVFMVVFLISVFLLKQQSTARELTVVGICCLAKFVLDFFRMRDSFLSPNQILCILVFMLFCIGYSVSKSGKLR